MENIEYGLENFDEEVTARLRVHRDKTLESLSERERWLLELTRTELNGEATFDPSQPRFLYNGDVAGHGHYHFDWRQAEKNGDTFYRQEHPLAIDIIQRAARRNLPVATLNFDYARHGTVVSVLQPLIGSSGWLELSKLTIQSLDTEEFLILAGCADDGHSLDDDLCRKLLLLPAEVSDDSEVQPADLAEQRKQAVNARVREVEERNMKFFDEEVVKLDHWSDDLKQSMEREIKDLDRQIREARKVAALAGTLREKLEGQKTIKALESTRKERRKRLFDAQDEIDSRRDELIEQIEIQLGQTKSVNPLFSIRWKLI